MNLAARITGDKDDESRLSRVRYRFTYLRTCCVSEIIVCCTSVLVAVSFPG
jgi:hypothetical protein